MYCLKCGNEIDDEALICPKCGCETSKDTLIKSSQTEEKVV